MGGTNLTGSEVEQTAQTQRVLRIELARSILGQDLASQMQGCNCQSEIIQQSLIDDKSKPHADNY